MKLSDRDSEKHKTSIERLKKVKKVIDKLLKQWYDIGVAVEKQNNKEPW